HNDTRFVIPGNQHYTGREFRIEVDPVSSSYFMAAAALTGGEVGIPGWNPHSPQGEAGFPEVLREMGCRVEFKNETLTVAGPEVGTLRAVARDMGDMPDVVQTLAVLAAFAQGTTRITNIGHLKYKESDRVGETAIELRKLGVHVEAGDDFLVIHGGAKPGLASQAVIESRKDHRMAMSFAVAGLAAPGLKISGEECVAKSFPDFFERFSSAGAALRRG
ncbi:MAG: 3-phosphoshikimate 1-carboxyvinyltransferase, partial [Spirochaetia bacterium]|nr:3-phosphoshikimate 1-carboxyvinyltransferase [Spirochaetia bacterium]